MIDLESPGALPALARQIKSDIDSYCVWKYDEGVGRSHLGASLIGHECSYYLSLSFRWAHHVTHSGRQYRLFQRGHFEEPRFVDYLEGIGCKVTMFDKVLVYDHAISSYRYISESEIAGDYKLEVVEDNAFHESEAKKQGVYLDKGHRQIRISACEGHFGGAIDGMCTLPERYGVPDDVIFLDEFKTQGLGKKYKNFIELVDKGMKVKKQQHFAQCSTYGYKLNLKYGIYMAVNKNDDDLHVEVIKLDHDLGKDLESKASMVIFGETPPSKISMSPSYFTCAYCDYCGICHRSEPIDRNCRSCKNCKPIENAAWYCGHYQQVVPKEFLRVGCAEWISYF